MSGSEETNSERLRAKLEPASIRTALIQAGTLLTGYELLKTDIVEKIRAFYSADFDESGRPIDGPRYAKDVLSLGNGKLEASLNWLLEAGAVTVQQVEGMDALRRHRNEVAHDLARFLVDPDSEIDVAQLRQLEGMIKSLDRFWGVITMQSDPSFDEMDVDTVSIQSGVGALFEYLLQVVEMTEQDHAPS